MLLSLSTGSDAGQADAISTDGSGHGPTGKGTVEDVAHAVTDNAVAVHSTLDHLAANLDAARQVLSADLDDGISCLLFCSAAIGLQRIDLVAPLLALPLSQRGARGLAVEALGTLVRSTIRSALCVGVAQRGGGHDQDQASRDQAGWDDRDHAITPHDLHAARKSPIRVLPSAEL